MKRMLPSIGTCQGTKQCIPVAPFRVVFGPVYFRVKGFFPKHGKRSTILVTLKKSLCSFVLEMDTFIKIMLSCIKEVPGLLEKTATVHVKQD